MRDAVKSRPVEKFDTDLKLPDWQLEPDDEFLFGDPDDYYYVDEQGNLIEPGGPQPPRGDNFPPARNGLSRTARWFPPARARLRRATTFSSRRPAAASAQVDAATMRATASHAAACT